MASWSALRAKVWGVWWADGLGLELNCLLGCHGDMYDGQCMMRYVQHRCCDFRAITFSLAYAIQ